MTKTEKLKKWTKEHREELVTGTVVTAIAGVYIGIVVATIKDLNRQEAEMNAAIEADNARQEAANVWIQDEFNAGNNVYAIGDYSYIVVPRTSEQKLVQK